MFFLYMKKLRRVLRFLVGQSLGKIISQLADQVTTAFLFKLDPRVLSKGQGQEQTSGWAPAKKGGCTLKTKLFFWTVIKTAYSFNEIAFVKVSQR